MLLMVSLVVFDLLIETESGYADIYKIRAQYNIMNYFLLIFSIAVRL